MCVYMYVHTNIYICNIDYNIYIYIYIYIYERVVGFRVRVCGFGFSGLATSSLGASGRFDSM